MITRIDWVGNQSLENIVSSAVLVLILLVVITVLAFVVIVFLVGLVVNTIGFLRQLVHINVVISATEGEEQRQWRRKRRQLWLSLLPFYRSKN